jgi:hypothetical protein
VRTLAAVGAVGQVLRADDKAFFVFLCGAVGGCIIARAFCDCHGCACVVLCCVGCVGGAAVVLSLMVSFNAGKSWIFLLGRRGKEKTAAPSALEALILDGIR